MQSKQNNIKQLVTHTKQGINIHAKAYKAIAMQYKAIKALSNTRLLNVLCKLYLILCKI
ncbi:hypothetical protein [Helicobacter bilis]|uniref:hypothetical protein n=1 Tax=Helicobacter bilis TaxID=37372 RepID=UPI0013158477|nr:hypothetical protein [Helicobacter bilis]